MAGRSSPSSLFTEGFLCSGFRDGVIFVRYSLNVVWVDVATAVARQCSKTAEVSRDWCSLIWSKGILEEFCIKGLACTKCWCLKWRLFLDLVSCYYVLLKFDFPFSTFVIRIILPKKTLFIETLQLVTSLLAVTIGWKCLTLGWCDKSMKMWIAQ